eukprot:Blabericola_migrator_1__6458@NODE_3259_length_1903_cov_131_022331_g2039_i0_p1_GENE_NODE_3259_length_1903_cov_131_022331_g2039_i0NODE_3259_length_1903_cov_131_022331_g2039_i0_p1_ORF_typecomplete_len414_score61_74Exo5/PF09810_9/1_5e50Cas_Cas4/PF01930_17/0_11PDDEXK_1/PF12705_7/0_0019_NODE_3259_length_1903_cov_131_022331_g2039_i05891830
MCAWACAPHFTQACTEAPQESCTPKRHPETCEKAPDSDEVDNSDTSIPLQRYRKWKLSVTDFSSQLWCESQLNFTLATGFRQETQAMRDGIARHERLEHEDHDVVEIIVKTREDNLGVRLVNGIISFRDLLPTNKKVREVWILGTPTVHEDKKCIVRGIVDEFALERSGHGEVVVIRDTKTRRDETEPCISQKRGSAIQLHMYRLMMEWLKADRVQWSAVWAAFKVDSQKDFESEVLRKYGKNVEEVAGAFVQVIKSLPPMADYVVVEYDCEGKTFKRDKIPYSESATKYNLQDLLAWWSGKRAPVPLLKQEKWKCRTCPFLGFCNASPLPEEERSRILDERREIELTLGLSDVESPLTACTRHSKQCDESLDAGLDDIGSVPKPTGLKRCLPSFSPTGVSPQRKQPSQGLPS